MNLLTNKKERTRFLKFAFVGFTGAIVDFGILNLLRLVFQMPLVWAQGISFTSAVINNFIWNRFWTYPETRKSKYAGQLLKFFIINIIGILIRTPLISWLNQRILSLLESLKWSLPLENFVFSQNIALSISILIVMLWNFFANRYWTYADVPVASEEKKQDQEKMKMNNMERN